MLYQTARRTSLRAFCRFTRPLRRALALPCAMLLAAAMGVRASAQPAHLNVQPTLAPIKSKLAQEGGVGSILVIGDSLSVRQGSYLPFFRTLLQSQYGDAGAGYQAFSLWTGAGFNSGWAKGMINEDTFPYRALDGLWSSFELPYSQYTSAYLTARNSQLELHYLGRPDGGTAIVAVPGKPNFTLNTFAPTTQLKTLSYTAPSADKQVWISPDKNGPITILGQINRTGNPGVILHRAANGGWGVENFLRRDFTFDRQVELVAPDLVMIWIGQNDQIYDRATYAPRLRLLVDRLRADAPGVPILFIGTYDSGSPRILPLVLAMADVAAERGLGFMDIYHAAGSKALFDYAGYLDDGLHFSDAGGQHIADLLFRAWNTDGSAMEICPADINHDGDSDLNDFFFFFGAWDLADPVVDLNQDREVLLDDFFEFFNRFDAGC